MRPLIFLFWRSVVNGIKRALSSPRRLIGLIFFFGYYYWIFVRSSFSPRGGRAGLPVETFHFDAPPIDVIDASVFALFVVMTIFLSLSLFSYRGGFKQADVDVLFPTPISPKVLLAFRMVRDSLISLIMPLLMAIFVMRPVGQVWTSMIRNLPHPESAGNVTRAMWVSYILSSMAFVAVGYAASIYFNRPEEKFERQRRWAGWSLFAVFALVSAFIVMKIREVSGAGDLVMLAQNPLLRTFFFVATGATELTMAPLTGSLLSAVVGSAILLGLIVAGVGLALSQAGYLYEESALRSADVNQARELQRKGDTFGMLAQQARSGRIKAGKKSWIHRLRLTGPTALLWKEYILQARATRVLFVLFPLIAITISIVPAMGMSSMQNWQRAVGPMMLVAQLMMVFVATASVSQGGYMEMLRRVDMQKPLPFTPGTIVFYEVLSKSTLGILISVASSVAVLIVAPVAWPQAVAALIGMPTLALLLASVFCLVILIFPDIEDPTQRGFRGLVSMLGILLFCAPATIVYLALLYFKVHPVLAAIPVAALNVLLAILSATMAGRFYATFNPSE